MAINDNLMFLPNGLRAAMVVPQSDVGTSSYIKGAGALV
jgi:hypothetical protein